MGMSDADLIRQLGISEMMCYRWKKKQAGLKPNSVRELKQVLDENFQQMKLVAELSLVGLELTISP